MEYQHWNWQDSATVDSESLVVGKASVAPLVVLPLARSEEPIMIKVSRVIEVKGTCINQSLTPIYLRWADISNFCIYIMDNKIRFCMECLWKQHK